MKIHRIIIFLALSFTFDNGFAQFTETDTLGQIMKKVFFEKKVYDKIFIKHPEFAEKPSVLLMSNIPIIRKYPIEKGDIINISSRVGKQNHSTRYIETEAGVVILTLSYYESDYELFVGLHKFSYSATEANVIFHTTSKYKVDSLANRYVKVTCSLINKNGEWKIKKLKIEKNDCCADYPYDALQIIDEKHYR